MEEEIPKMDTTTSPEKEGLPLKDRAGRASLPNFWNKGHFFSDCTGGENETLKRAFAMPSEKKTGVNL